jgi:large-conductance mechanosensitive channel
MDQPGNTLTSDRAEAGKWMGRVVIAVILGEAIWNLIVSVMNNLIVPWVGDVMGQSSGLPTSFRQRPYNYPDLFVSVFEFCIAGLVAAILNYFFQRSAPRVKVVRAKSVATPATIEPVRMVAPLQAVAVPSRPDLQPPAFQPPANQPAEAAALRPVASPAPVSSAPNLTATPAVATPSVVQSPITPAPINQPPVTQAPIAPPQVARPVVPTPAPVPSAAPKPAPKPTPAKPKKPKEIYYNIVGEPMPSDED